jgi:hypothetical protein
MINDSQILSLLIGLALGALFTIVAMRLLYGWLLEQQSFRNTIVKAFFQHGSANEVQRWKRGEFIE